MKRQDLAAAAVFAALCCAAGACLAALRPLVPRGWFLVLAVLAAGALLAVLFLLQRAARKFWRRPAGGLLWRVAAGAPVVFAAAAVCLGLAARSARAGWLWMGIFCAVLAAAYCARGAAECVLQLSRLVLTQRSGLAVTAYTLRTAKLAAGQSVRLAVVSDLHGCLFGAGQRALLDAVAAQQPDLILVPGDVFDRRAPQETALCALRGLAALAPCLASTGNHDLSDFDGAASVRLLQEAGVQVLAGGVQERTVRGAALCLAGIDDPDGGDAEWQRQLACAQSEAAHHPASVRILLLHRPNCAPRCAEGGAFDLIVSGHAHGGQWAFPFAPQGLFAPDQGIFPRCTAGLFRLVPRGAANGGAPQPDARTAPETGGFGGTGDGCPSGASVAARGGTDGAAEGQTAPEQRRRRSRLHAVPVRGNTAALADAPVLAVSRGLAKETVPLPRFGNPREVLCLTLTGPA